MHDSRMKGGLVGPPCSRNPHDEAVVVRRAQLGTKSGHPLKEGHERAPRPCGDGILSVLRNRSGKEEVENSG